MDAETLWKAQFRMWYSGGVSPSGRCCYREIFYLTHSSSIFPITKAGAFAPPGDTPPPSISHPLNH
ncbi:hypothetical protein [Paenibacillus sp. RC67]|uniref:hypothetical protein n=1 Tax=Paenibacillus sp. RC67 TaxID=3039392 RepID=UPI0024AD4AAF|nr:hypothetical protein [Paenibacillus sp. RC67]